MKTPVKALALLALPVLGAWAGMAAAAECPAAYRCSVWPTHEGEILNGMVQSRIGAKARPKASPLLLVGVVSWQWGAGFMIDHAPNAHGASVAALQLAHSAQRLLADEGKRGRPFADALTLGRMLCAGAGPDAPCAAHPFYATDSACRLKPNARGYRKKLRKCFLRLGKH